MRPMMARTSRNLIVRAYAESMALLIYSVLRILLVVAAGAVLYLLGLRSWLLVLAAVLVGAGLSYVLLEGPRRKAADAVAARRAGGDRFSRALADEAAEEDAEADSMARLRREARSEPVRSGGAEEQGGQQDQAEGELEESGVPQDSDEVATGGPAEDPAREDHDHRRQ
ncbi:DUF4229 domain-containing protein [Occultella glacieicola]|uniref:DUF4229 domain-containing protein n=1 Tax=Occultella glacieicola TaxID=2518684 RepID=A0ABY2E194_9MICO|nr:DUF4229 domain-containing protein [Occultella glacieicola]